MSEMYNYYIALLHRGGPVVTLPVTEQLEISIWEKGEVSGQTGASGMWNGPLPQWCDAVVRVKSKEPWARVAEEEKTYLWMRQDDEKTT